MSIYTSGRNIAIGPQTNLKGLSPGKDYIFQYKAPGFAFMLLSPEAMAALVEGWVNLRSKIDTARDDEILTITGVSVNTDTGDIFIRGSVAGPSNVLQQGINPYAVAAVLAAVFAAIGIGVSLLYVYEVAGSFVPGGSDNGPAIDPCTDSGVIATVKCWAKESSLLLKGAIFGALAIMLVILYKRSTV